MLWQMDVEKNTPARSSDAGRVSGNLEGRTRTDDIRIRPLPRCGGYCSSVDVVARLSLVRYFSNHAIR